MTKEQFSTKSNTKLRDLGKASQGFYHKIAKESFNEFIKTGEFLIKNETQKLNSQTKEILKQASEDDCIALQVIRSDITSVR